MSDLRSTHVWSVNVDLVGESGTHALRCVLVALMNNSFFFFTFLNVAVVVECMGVYFNSLGDFLLKAVESEVSRRPLCFGAFFFQDGRPFFVSLLFFCFLFFSRHKNAALFPGELIVPLVPGSEGDCINGGFSVSGP